jgi:Flp pilus assembly protein TadD
MSVPTTPDDARHPTAIQFEAMIPWAIALVTAGVFARAIGNEFLVWDDLQYLVRNPDYRGLGWENVAWAFSNVRCGHYMPLVWLSWSLDYALWGMNAEGYILGNILIHAANAAVFYLIVLRLLRLAGHTEYSASTGTRTRLKLWAAVAALFFAIHPLRTESVVWATERKDVLCGLFYLLAVHVYLRQGGRRSRAALLLFVLAALTKSMAVSLPLVLIVLDVYPLRRLGGRNGWISPAARRVWIPKIPFLAVAAGAAALAPVATRLASATWRLQEHDLATRFASLAYSLWFYVLKTVLPVGLSPLYERPPDLDPWTPRYLWAAGFVLAATALLVAVRRRFPAGLAAWVCYGVILAPVSGLVPVGPQLVADRYSYLSCLGFAVLLASGGLRIGTAVRPRPALAGAVAVLTVLGLATWRQTGFWRDSVSLWERALAVDDRCGSCHLNLGATLLEQGDPEGARLHLEAALRLNPNKSRAQYNYGLLLDRQGRPEQAIGAYRRALELEPGLSAAANNLSKLLVKREQYAEAMQVLRAQTVNNPSAWYAKHGLAWLLATCPDRSLRNGPEAAALARQVCEASAYRDPKALLTLAVAQAEAGRRDQALETAAKALELAAEQNRMDLADQIAGHLRDLRATRTEDTSP